MIKQNINEYDRVAAKTMWMMDSAKWNDGILLVLATVPVLDPTGIIGLRGYGLTPSKIDDFLSEPSL